MAANSSKINYLQAVSPPAGQKRPSATGALSHEQVMRVHTGWEICQEDWAERQKSRKLLLEQSNYIADVLETQGIKSRLENDITAIGAVTLQTDKLDSFRTIRFIPSVAQRDRRPMLNALRYFLENEPGASRYTRYAVVTFGQPLVPLVDDLSGAVSDLTRRISRWSSEVLEKFNIEVIYRGVEYTLHDRDGSGVETLHLHANVLYWPRSKLTTEKWLEFLNFTKQRLASHWKDCGKVGNASEIVKYVIKPEDVCGCTPEVIKWLYEGSFKKRLSSGMNSFKKFTAELKEEKEKIINVRKVGLCRVKKSERLKHIDRKESDYPKSERPVKNIILGITLPQHRFTPWGEPMILVQNFDKNAATPSFMEEIYMIKSSAMFHWEENGAPDVNIALAVGKAWEEEAVNIVPFRGRCTKPAGQQAGAAGPASYKVHTCSVIVQSDDDDHDGLEQFLDFVSHEWKIDQKIRQPIIDHDMYDDNMYPEIFL